MHARSVYQLNTRVWLREMAEELGRPINLADIPDAQLEQFSTLGFEFIWLLGIWKTGAAGRKVSATNPDWRPGYQETLGAGLREDDICGSPFAVQEYVVHPEFGGNDALRSLRDRLQKRGLRLILDFVANHTALDHPWVKERPEFYIHGTEEDLAREPYNYCRVETGQGTRILAYGRDHPCSHGWLDTLQLDYRHPALREAMGQQLLQIAKMCDGLRCDMAMLMLPDIFARTWGSQSQPADRAWTTDRAFWPEAIALVHRDYRDFVFIAEVYWDKEWEMQQQGFDYTYDKRLYDRLVQRDAQAVRAHLEGAPIDFQRRMVRFLENHDEPRAASVFPFEVHRAAAVLAFLAPGLRLFQEGQLEGRKVKVSIHLRRRPAEAVDQAVNDFYSRLLPCTARPEVENGDWRLLECVTEWGGNTTWKQFIAFAWAAESGKLLLVAVNYAPQRGKCFVRLPFPSLRGRSFRLQDLLSADKYPKNGDDLVERGLYLDLPEWGYSVFEFVEQPTEIPGLKGPRILQGHQDIINRIAWCPEGRHLASVSNDKTLRLWDTDTGNERHVLESALILGVAWSDDGKQLATGGADNRVSIWRAEGLEKIKALVGHSDWVNSVAWLPGSQPNRVVSASADFTVRLWDTKTGEPRVLGNHLNNVFCVACSPDGKTIASASADRNVRLWEINGDKSGPVLKGQKDLQGHTDQVLCVAWAPNGKTLASASLDNTVRVWEAETGRLIAVLEAHRDDVRAIAFSADSRLLASKGADAVVRIWRCEDWQILAELPEQNGDGWLPGLAFHRQLPLLATLDAEDKAMRVWDFDYKILSGGASPGKTESTTTAKIVLLGESGVGKTGLGWRLAHGQFTEQASSHGQRFWPVEALRTRRPDGVDCEAILWDLAGQPDYRLVHALFLDDADLALIVIDPTDRRSPLRDVQFWLKQLEVAKGQRCPTILVGARIDRGTATLTQEDLDAFCRDYGIEGGYVATSAMTGEAIDELLGRMKATIHWDKKVAVVGLTAFKRIKDCALILKEQQDHFGLLLSWEQLSAQLNLSEPGLEVTDRDMRTAVGHLANFGYVRLLRTSLGEERILLAPELLNNLAASFILEARRNPKGLGSVEERLLLANDYRFRELEPLSSGERSILIESATLQFLRCHLCFREVDPITTCSYLVFPELINLTKPEMAIERRTEEGASYTVSGAIENVYASLVVLLGYTNSFTRTDQWKSQARYEFANGSVCGFRQVADPEREGEVDFVLYYGTDTSAPVRGLFQSLFEAFLTRTNLRFFRYEPIICRKGHQLARSVIREQLGQGADAAFCPRCGERLSLREATRPIQVLPKEPSDGARIRSYFEQSVFSVQAYIRERNITPPTCFISYAWGEMKFEQWVEQNLAKDLQKAGIDVVLDRWENARIGASVPRFVDRIEKCDRVIVVGTPLYRRKYENKDTTTGYVVAAEVDMISNRLVGTEAQKETVLPLLLDGEKTTSLPPLLHSRVFADFRKETLYFTTAFDLILSLYEIPFGDPAVAASRESLGGGNTPGTVAPGRKSSPGSM